MLARSFCVAGKYPIFTTLTNKTKSSVTSFKGFISNKWPNNGKRALKVLGIQLKHCGGFSETMDLLNLSTPSHCDVRLDSDKVLALLRNKTKVSPVQQLKEFVLVDIT